MTWFKVDDKSAFHSKVIAAGNEAWGALCRAGAWSSGEFTDGFIPDRIALMIATKRSWNRLETCGGPGKIGLVERVSDGWQIHDFTFWNLPAEVAKAEQAFRHDRARKAAEARWNAHHDAPPKESIKQAGSNATDDAKSNATSIANSKAQAHASRAPDPVPSRPVPSGIQSPDPVPTEQVVELPAKKPERKVAPSLAEKALTPVERVFDYWREKLSPKAKLDPKREKTLAAALKLYSVEELCRVVDGTLKNTHRMGQNDRAKKFIGIDLLFRDAEHIDDAIALAEEGTTESNADFEWGNIPPPHAPDPPGTQYVGPTEEDKRVLESFLGDGALDGFTPAPPAGSES